MRNGPAVGEVLVVEAIELGPSITFEDGEANTHLQPHNDALVIVVDIDHVYTHLVLIDGEARPTFTPLECSNPRFVPDQA